MRKKILLMLAALLTAVSANAFEWTWEPKYVGEYHIGYGTTAHINDYDRYVGRAIFGTIQGVSLNDYLEVGVGVEGLMLTHYYKGDGLRWGMDAYANLRGGYPITDTFKVFLNLGLGSQISLKPSGGHGFFCEFGPGFRYKKFNFSFGLQKIGKGEGTSTFFVKTGMYF